MVPIPHSWNDTADFIITWLPIVLFGIIAFLMWKTTQYMPRVKPPPVDSESTELVAWSDIAGLDEAKEELREVVDFLQDRKRFERLGARVPKGILLHGPPGTGKTLLAKAIAHESGAHFYASSALRVRRDVRGPGGGAHQDGSSPRRGRTRRRSSSSTSSMRPGSVRQGGGGYNREHDQTLNQLLVELDGFGGRDDVIVIGASNRLGDLDPALLRPGRFDRQVLVGPPDLTGRESILRVHTRSKPLAADVDLSLIARQTSGLTGADLANICNEAAILAAPRRHEASRPRVRRRAGACGGGPADAQGRHGQGEADFAFHEAGHALMSYLMGGLIPVQKVTIVSRGEALGYTFNVPAEDRYLHTREELQDLMKVLLSGRAAEQIVFGRITNGAANDLERVTGIARSMVFEFGMSDVAPRARCAPTTTRSRRSRSACATPSRHD